jgi:hypothetical protein
MNEGKYKNCARDVVQKIMPRPRQPSHHGKKDDILPFCLTGCYTLFFDRLVNGGLRVSSAQLVELIGCPGRDVCAHEVPGL